MPMSPIPNWARAATAAALAACLATPAAAQSLDFWGAFASGSARQCPGGLCGGGQIESANDGAFGASSAAVAFSDAGRAAHPGVDFAAQASLVGALEIPELKAMAFADSASRYTANARAEAVQAYVYTGAVEQAYVLNVAVSGSIVGDANLSGFVIVYDADGYNPAGEVPGTRLDNTFFTWSATSQAQPAPLEFTLQPGDAVYLQAVLFANADSRNVPSHADAFHTLTLSFQNASGLVQAAAVPEPGTWALLLAGGAWLLARRRA